MGSTMTVGSLAANVNVIVLAATIATSMCSPTDPVGGVTWRPGLRLSRLDDVDARMLVREDANSTEPVVLFRPDTLGADQQMTATSCRDYLAAVEAGFRPRGKVGLAQEQSYVMDCYILRDLKTARPPAAKHLPNWSYTLLSQLPPILTWGVGRRETNPALSWMATRDGLHGTAITE